MLSAQDTHGYMFSTGRWKLIHPRGTGSVHPYPRAHAPMWSERTGRVFLQGGVNRDGIFDDMLSLDAHTERWKYVRPADAAKQVNPASPSSRDDKTTLHRVMDAT